MGVYIVFKKSSQVTAIMVKSSIRVLHPFTVENYPMHAMRFSGVQGGLMGVNQKSFPFMAMACYSVVITRWW